jgi:4-hydroxythreonine-4-phosphate dehydrogenase
MHDRPIIGITMGDPSGVGPEVTAGALIDRDIREMCRPVVIGDFGVMSQALNLAGNTARLKAISDIRQWEEDSNVVNIIDLNNLKPSDFVIGKINPASGRASVEYILKAARMALDGQIAALVTAPINKEATRLSGYGELGHLEILARYTQTKDYATMLVSENLRVVHLTTHYPLKEALEKIKKDYILARLKLTNSAFVDWGYAHPVIAVAALNPHGGEGGIIGRDEIEEISPAVNAAQALGIDARGPYPADTIFNRALKGEFDVVIALYHDQGHIPIKVHNVEKSISIALGLPFIRTSVDHGTAYDIAWQGKADATSMKEAVRVAVALVKREFK